MSLIPKDAFKKLSTTISESRAKSNLMEDFPPICKKDPINIQMHFITDHFETDGQVIRLEDVPEEMYGGALPVAKSRKSKRKETSKEEYLEAEQPSKKDKKDKASDKLKIGGSGLQTIEEEVQDLNTDAVLNKRTRSGKAATSTQTAPEQPPIPKKMRKTIVMKIKESAYVTQEEEDVEASTELVTREVKRKKAEDAAALQKALEVAKETEIPASSVAREDAVIDAQEVVKATEDLQELVASEAGNMLMVVSAGEDVQEDKAAGS